MSGKAESEKLKAESSVAGLYAEFGEIERLLVAARFSPSTLDALDALETAGAKVFSLKERLCRAEPQAQGQRLLPFRATVFDRGTGAQAQVRVDAEDMHDAERRAKAKANLELQCGPQALVVRHLHELCPVCERERGEGWA